jgi:protocatechuate 3,4-dioxygenase beta subunit
LKRQTARMTTQTPAPQVELIVLADARTLLRQRERQVRRLRRHLARSGRADWTLTVAHGADRLDAKALRTRFAGRSASVVAFIRLDASFDLESLLAPVSVHTASPKAIHRRRALKQAAGAVGGLAVLAACGSTKRSSSTVASTTPAATKPPSSTSGPTTAPTVATTTSTKVATTADPAAAPTPLAAETTEGPYYLDLNNVRRDIREDRKGAPLELSILVVDPTGTPIPGAAVDIWHCDAEGTYSGFSTASAAGNGGGGGGRGPGGPPPGGGGPPPGGASGQPTQSGSRTVQVATPNDSTTFLRGTQVADPSGRVSFTTVFPGWYQGRTVHIHVLAHVGGNVVHIGQIFFDDVFTDDVFASNDPYSSRQARGMRNANDGIFKQAGGVTTPAAKSGSGYAAQVTMAVKR